jgi:hypothetical protein
MSQFEATACCTYKDDDTVCGYTVSVTAPDIFVARDSAEMVLYEYHKDQVNHPRGDVEVDVESVQPEE